MYLRFFYSINEVEWSSQIKGTGDLSSILRLFTLFDCNVIRTSQLSCPQHYFQLIFIWLTHTECCKLLLFTKKFAWITSVSSFERSRHAYMALYFRMPWLSVNFGTDLDRSGTQDARRQFRDCPGHSRTVGNPRSRPWLKAIAVAEKLKKLVSPHIRVARIFDWGGPNHKSHAMTSSKNFKKGTFCGAKIS